jgi:hypothetical protein
VVNIRTENGIYAGNKGDGYYVFVDCYPGKYRIFVEPSVYEKQTFEIELDDSVQVRYIMLQPAKNYPLINQALKISGKCHKEVYAALEGGDCGSVIEKCPSGETNIRIYFAGMTGIVGRNFYFSNGEQYEIRRITQGEKECFTLDEPLSFEVMPYTQILPVYEAYVKDGQYYMTIRKIYKKIYLLGQQEKKALELQSDMLEYDCDFLEE